MPDQRYKKCVYCGEEIDYFNTRCAYCGSVLTTDSATGWPVGENIGNPVRHRRTSIGLLFISGCIIIPGIGQIAGVIKALAILAPSDAITDGGQPGRGQAGCGDTASTGRASLLLVLSLVAFVIHFILFFLIISSLMPIPEAGPAT